MSGKKIEISVETHRILKVFCAKNDLKLGEFVDRLVRERIESEKEDIQIHMQPVRTDIHKR